MARYFLLLFFLVASSGPREAYGGCNISSTNGVNFYATCVGIQSADELLVLGSTSYDFISIANSSDLSELPDNAFGEARAIAYYIERSQPRNIERRRDITEEGNFFQVGTQDFVLEDHFLGDDGLIGIEKIEITKNPWTGGSISAFPWELMTELSTLEVLSIYDQDLHADIIPHDVFATSLNLKTLNLERDFLSTFDTVMPKNLVRLSLSGNILQAFDCTVLEESAQSLVSLYLDDNDITELLMPGAAVFVTLEILDISGQSIRMDIPVNERMPNLRYFMANNVGTTEFPSFITNQQTLEGFELSGNAIVDVPAMAMESSSKMTYLALSVNEIQSFPRASLYTPQEAADSTLRINLYRAVDVNNATDADLFDAEAFGNGTRKYLYQLDLSFNALSFLPEQPFAELFRDSYNRYVTGLQGDVYLPRMIAKMGGNFITCCSIGWLFKDGLRYGSSYEYMFSNLECRHPENSGFVDVFDAGCQTFSNCADVDQAWMDECDLLANPTTTTTTTTTTSTTTTTVIELTEPGLNSAQAIFCSAVSVLLPVALFALVG